MKLGKLDPKFEDRDFPLKALLRPGAPSVPLPDAYDVDASYQNLIYPMFANDVYGCCVISGRAHQTLRFELKEQSKLLSISDKDVIDEYLRQTGGEDTGLVVSSSLREWRKTGWLIGVDRYFSRAYARIDHRSHRQVRIAIFADTGVGIGMSIPQSAMDQFDKGQPWDVVDDDGGSLGGHYVYLPAYDQGTFTCVTWGRRQKMTTAFFTKYVDEAWCVFDALDTKKKANQLIDLPKVQELLRK